MIQDELNVKTITTVDNLDGIVQYAYKPNLKTLGPKYGKLLGMLRKDLPNLAPEILAPLRSGSNVSIEMGGETIELEPDDVLVSTEQSSEWGTADDSGVQVAISTKLSPELIEEGMARDFVRHVQQLRKDADLEIENRIRIQYRSDASEIKQMLNIWSEYISAETLADSIESRQEIADGKSVSVGEFATVLSICLAN